MPNQYSIEIHKYLTEKIAEAEKMLDGSSSEQNSYYQGQLEELCWIRKYLGENIDLKDFSYY